MPGVEQPLPLSEASRRFLEDFLDQLRRARLPGSAGLIEKIDNVLSRRQPIHGRGHGVDDAEADSEGGGQH